MARLLLFLLAAYGVLCTAATESANLTVEELFRLEYRSVTGSFEEHANSENDRQTTERFPSEERNANMHRKIAEFYLDYVDPQPNKDHASSAPHTPPPVKHA